MTGCRIFGGPIYAGTAEDIYKLETEQVDYKYDDELEEESIDDNFTAILRTLLGTLTVRDQFDLREFSRILEIKFINDLFRNSDYYSFIEGL